MARLSNTTPLIVVVVGSGTRGACAIDARAAMTTMDSSDASRIGPSPE
jgi:hypothetical protein